MRTAISAQPSAASPRRRRASRAAFTLVELLVVIVIIMILVGIVLGTAKYAQGKAARSRAQAEIAMLETALEQYKSDNGAYPVTPPVRPVNGNAPAYANSPLLYTALTASKAYMTFKPNQLVVKGGVTYIVDPFGSPYDYYCKPGAADQINSPTYDLWSNGPDGQNNTADDIVNWRQ